MKMILTVAAVLAFNGVALAADCSKNADLKQAIEKLDLTGTVKVNDKIYTNAKQYGEGTSLYKKAVAIYGAILGDVYKLDKENMFILTEDAQSCSIQAFEGEQASEVKAVEGTTKLVLQQNEAAPTVVVEKIK